jgi:hypothetical protein
VTGVVQLIRKDRPIQIASINLGIWSDIEVVAMLISVQGMTKMWTSLKKKATPVGLQLTNASRKVRHIRLYIS